MRPIMFAISGSLKYRVLQEEHMTAIHHSKEVVQTRQPRNELTNG